MIKLISCLYCGFLLFWMKDGSGVQKVNIATFVVLRRGFRGLQNVDEFFGVRKGRRQYCLVMRPNEQAEKEMSAAWLSNCSPCLKQWSVILCVRGVSSFPRALSMLLWPELAMLWSGPQLVVVWCFLCRYILDALFPTQYLFRGNDINKLVCYNLSSGWFPPYQLNVLQTNDHMKPIG